MQHLLDFFDRYMHGPRTAVIYDDGLRRWQQTYAESRAAAEAFADRLSEAGVKCGDRVVIWGENRPEWVAAFWGCVLRGVIVVPVDARAPATVFQRTVDAANPHGVVVGDTVEAPPASSARFVWRLRNIAALPAANIRSPRVSITPDTIVEIVFTSGTTGDPKGVPITHANIVANITPIERSAGRYRRYLWIFRPLRFLCLLPLSHLFGQALTMFLPPLVGATVVLMKGHNPQEIATEIRRSRITLAVVVPRMLEMLRERVADLAPRRASVGDAPESLLRRVWRHRRVHRRFGWKFCGFVVGGAQLDAALERSWRRLGYVVVQGYGLTETAPIVAWNDPFRTREGTVGVPLEGVEVRIAPDGEILVRGPTVVAGYLGAPAETDAAFEAGWFHTGDVGALDDSGRLVVRGRKKDVIVTGEGMHVFPEDVEAVLERIAGVREAAVVGRMNGAERVHAVLVLEPGTDAAAMVREANTRLAVHQRIQDFSVWPEPALPRTDALGKVKRLEIRRWVAGGARPTAAAPEGDVVTRLIARYAANRRVDDATTLDALGLSSLDRIELTMALEEHAGVSLSDASVARAGTVQGLRRLLAESSAGEVAETLALPRWARTWPARAVRNASLALWVLPLAHLFLRLHVHGRDRLDALRDPVIFAANHQSHFDTPALLLALPPRYRYASSVAMAAEGVRSRMLAWLAALFFNAFPLPRSGPGARDTLRYMGELVSTRHSILIFPEGHRTEHGEIHPFQPGIAMMAARLRLSVVPVRLEGVDRVLHHTWHWPRRGDVHVSFGAPIAVEGDDYPVLTKQVEATVRAIAA